MTFNKYMYKHIMYPAHARYLLKQIYINAKLYV